jgi:hypothetical protein
MRRVAFDVHSKFLRPYSRRHDPVGRSPRLSPRAANRRGHGRHAGGRRAQPSPLAGAAGGLGTAVPRGRGTRRDQAKRGRRAARHERLAAIEKAKLDALLDDANAWRTANNVRDYIRAIREAAGERANTAEFESWLRWASGEAEKLDPINSRRVLGELTGAGQNKVDEGSASGAD